MTSPDRALRMALRDISQMTGSLHLPDTVTDRASSLFKRVHEGKTLKYRSNRTAIVSACVYIACKQEYAPRTFKAIAAVSNTNKKKIGKAFKLIIENLEINLKESRPGHYVPQFCSELDLSPELQEAAVHVADKAVDKGLVPGRGPVHVAAAAIYLAVRARGIDKTC